MTLRHRVPLLVPLVLLSACGITFNNDVLNRDLPKSFTNRTLWPDTSIFQYKLAELPGTIIFEEKLPDGSMTYTRKSRVLAGDYAPSFEAIKDGEIYTSKIDKGASAKGSYLALAADLSTDETADVTIVDAGMVFIPWDKVPVDAIKDEAGKPRPAGARRFWIQAVLLTQMTKKTYTSIKANASGVVGDTFGANGKVFNSKSSALRDPVIGMLVIDIDKFADEDKKLPPRALGAQLSKNQVETMLELARAPGIFKQRLQ